MGEIEFSWCVIKSLVFIPMKCWSDSFKDPYHFQGRLLSLKSVKQMQGQYSKLWYRLKESTSLTLSQESDKFAA